MPPLPSRRKRPWLTVLRWTIGAAAMAATWGYGAWKGGSVMWISIPVGAIVGVSVASALSVPLVTAALVTVAFIYGIDSGMVPALRDVAVAVIAIGLPMAGWRIAVGLRERNRRK
ncbi:MAG TPA: hypothetical protein VFB13_12220 [Reyranella sp.]|nr:hypothetical protein [Reyranella sp.]